MSTQWHPIDKGPLTKARWQQWLSTGVRLDPYLIWADLSNGAGSQSPPGAWPVLIELACDHAPLPLAAGQGSCRPEAAQNCHPAMGLIDVPQAYQIAGKEGELPTASSRFITATVSPCNVEALLCHSDFFVRVQLGVARLAASTGKSRGPFTADFFPDLKVLVGVIDDGFAFAHAQFRSESMDIYGNWEPRITYLWDQNPREIKPGQPWAKPEGFAYGQEVDNTGLTQAIAAAAQRADQSPYAWLDYLPHQVDADSRSLGAMDSGVRVPSHSLLTTSHGTAVLALAAGNQPPLGRWHPVQGQVPAQPLDRDAASQTAIALVQLPTRTTLDSSGGSLGVHVLDGLNYLLALARPNDKEPVPLVANISYGAIAGPHDGTSILEQAITDLVSHNDQVWVTVAAGNAHGANTHARLELEEGQTARKRLTWRIGPDNLLESYLEIWLPDCDTNGCDLDDSHRAQILITLMPPAGLPKLQVRANTGWALGDDADGPPVAAAIFSRQVVQGLRGTMVLLTVARTRRPLAGSPETATAATAPHGDWVLELQWPGPAAPTRRRMAVHAWAERNDQLWGHGRKQQSTVWGDDPVPAKTEFSPTVLEFCAHGDLPYHLDEVPKPFQPELSHGSVGDVDPAGEAFCERLFQSDPSTIADRPPVPPDQHCARPKPFDHPIKGAAVAVGGYRLADQEMAAYSGGGPTRSARADRGRLTGGTCTAHTLPPVTAVDGRYPTRQHGPAVDAPSDVGTALRGLRTIGLRDGSVARLGGTSAAAPLLARHIAATLQAQLSTQAGTSSQMLVDATASTLENARRATLTPTQDDRFRRGQERLVPGAASPTAPAKTGS